VTMALEMRGVRKAFRGRDAVRGIDWSVPAAAVCGLIGANGAGKTTLLRLALGVLCPDAGEVTVLGERLGLENAALRERVHYVASDRPMAPAYRIDEWLRYASLAYPRWDRARAQRLLAALELDPRRGVGELSFGQRTSLQVLVAAAARPDLLLLDEPTDGLDVVVKTQVLQLVMDMAAAEGTTLVLASHHIEDVERLSDRLAVLYDGRLVLEGELDVIKARMHRLQVVLPGAFPTELEQDPTVVRVERRGKVALLTVDGPAEPVAERCVRLGAVLVEPVDLDLAEVFRIVLAKEGYSRAQLQWNVD
jgi:ABC-2 type transport system ATP-binding protein